MHPATAVVLSKDRRGDLEWVAEHQRLGATPARLGRFQRFVLAPAGSGRRRAVDAGHVLVVSSAWAPTTA